MYAWKDHGGVGERLCVSMKSGIEEGKTKTQVHEHIHIYLVTAGVLIAGVHVVVLVQSDL